MGQLLVEAAHQRDSADDKTAVVVWFGDTPNAPPPAVTAPALLARARLQPKVAAGRKGISDDMFAERKRPKAEQAELAELDDLFTAYAREMDQSLSAMKRKL